jgi:hypothetical protein
MTCFTQKRHAAVALIATAALTLAAGPGLSQTIPAPAAETRLQTLGEHYHRAPDAAQNPAEVEATRRLNAEVAQRNAAADRAESADAEAVLEANAAARADYRASVAETRAENQRRENEAEAIAAHSADQQARYEKAMADWRSTVRACETGNTARCRAGQQRPILTDFSAVSDR